jgi:hypothetical protein
VLQQLPSSVLMYRGDERLKRGSDRADVDGRTCWHVAIALHFDSAVIIIIISIYHHPPLLAPLWALISLKMRPGTIIANSSQVKQVVARGVTGSGRPADWLTGSPHSLHCTPYHLTARVPAGWFSFIVGMCHVLAMTADTKERRQQRKKAKLSLTNCYNK